MNFMCMQTLSEKEVNLVLKNEKLIHLFLSHLKFDRKYYDDLVSVGKIGLVKAAKTFDESKNFAFSTYAYQFIKNEIYSFFRKEIRHMNYIYLDAPTTNDSDALTLIDTIADPSPDFTETIANKDYLVNIINIILNKFSPRERFVLLSKLSDQLSIDELSKTLKISRAYLFEISRIMYKKLALYLTKPSSYEKKHNMTYENGVYTFTFTFTNSKFALAKDFLTNNRNKNLVNYQISYNNTIVVIMLDNQKSFQYIADLFLAVDNNFIKKVNTPSNDDTISQIITKYLLNLDVFYVKDITNMFPNYESKQIRNTICKLRKKGIIIQISYGRYKVNKHRK